jgi:hypothetical protein
VTELPSPLDPGRVERLLVELLHAPQRPPHLPRPARDRRVDVGECYQILTLNGTATPNSTVTLYRRDVGVLGTTTVSRAVMLAA